MIGAVRITVSFGELTYIFISLVVYVVALSLGFPSNNPKRGGGFYLTGALFHHWIVNEGITRGTWWTILLIKHLLACLRWLSSKASLPLSLSHTFARAVSSHYSTVKLF